MVILSLSLHAVIAFKRDVIWGGWGQLGKMENMLLEVTICVLKQLNEEMRQEDSA